MTNNRPKKTARYDPVLEKSKDLFAYVWADTPQQFDALRGHRGDAEKRDAMTRQDARVANPTGAALTAEYTRNQEQIERLQARNAEIWQPAATDEEESFEEYQARMGDVYEEETAPATVTAAASSDPAYDGYMARQFPNGLP